MSEYLTINETAEMFAVSTRTVRRWVDDGTVRAYRLGPRMIRIDIDSISGVYEAMPSKLSYHNSQKTKTNHAYIRSTAWKDQNSREIAEENIQLRISSHL